MFLNLSEVPKELKIRYVVREFIYFLHHTGAVWLTHSLHSALGNSAVGNCGQPVPLAGVGMGGGSGFETERGDCEGARRAGCPLLLDTSCLKEERAAGSPDCSLRMKPVLSEQPARHFLTG